MTEIVVTESEAGRNVTAAVGDKIKIVLPENPTTGFRWQIASIDAGILRPGGDEYVAGGATGVGGGGQHVFQFDAASRGAAIRGRGCTALVAPDVRPGGANPRVGSL